MSCIFYPKHYLVIFFPFTIENITGTNAQQIISKENKIYTMYACIISVVLQSNWNRKRKKLFSSRTHVEDKVEYQKNIN